MEAEGRWLAAVPDASGCATPALVLSAGLGNLWQWWLYPPLFASGNSHHAPRDAQQCAVTPQLPLLPVPQPRVHHHHHADQDNTYPPALYLCPRNTCNMPCRRRPSQAPSAPRPPSPLSTARHPSADLLQLASASASANANPQRLGTTPVPPLSTAPLEF